MRKIFSLIFVLLLLAPAAVWLVDFDFEPQVERIGLKPPRFNVRALFDNEYYLYFDQYFNDNFSIRSPLLLAKRWLDYRIFHMTEVNGVHVGTKGWLYSRQSIEDYRKAACGHMPDMQRLVLELHAIEKLVEATGRRFIFTVAPSKTTIYPEHVGFVPKNTACNRSQYDLFLEAIGSNRLKGFVRLEQLLQNTKLGHPLLYHKTGTYWNNLGARIAAEAIQAQINPDKRLKQRLDYNVRDEDGSGDLAERMMGFFTAPDDVPISHYGSLEAPEFYSAVVYGDDYIQNLIPYLRQIFNRFEVIRTDSIPSRQYGENWQASDYILLERAESGLASMRLEIDRIFSMFEAEARIRGRYLLDLKNAVPGANVSLSKSAKYLEIKSVGHRSTFKLPAVAASHDRIFRVLKLTVKALHSDLLTVEYMTAPPLAVVKSLRPGITTLYLPLPFQELISLNIHPGSRAGVLFFQSAEILEFPEIPAGIDSGQEKTLLARSDKKNEMATPDTKTETVSSESDTSLEIAALKPNDESDTDSNTGAPVYSPASKSNTAVVVEKDPQNPNGLQPQEDDIPVSVQQSEPGRLDSSPENLKDLTRKSEITPKVSTSENSTAPYLAVTDFENGRIFQRKRQSAAIVVSGTYRGRIEGVEARVVRNNTAEEIVPWTVIDPSPQNGIFVGELSGIPQGGWYSIQVRSQTDHTVIDKGKHKWGVGMLIAGLGQSNMKEWFYTGKDLTAHALLRKFDHNGWSKLNRTGNAAIAFGNRLIERLGIPVGLLDFSVNGSGLRKEADWGTGFWADTAPDSIYHRFVSGVTDAGGTLEFVIWIQGEADAARGTVTEDEYAGSLMHFIENQVRIDIASGSDSAQLPFLVVPMIKRPGGKDGPHQAIRNAQKRVAEKVAGCYLSAGTLDLKNHGRQHLTPKAYISMGKRVAQTVLYVLGEETYHRGPSVAGATQIDKDTIEIAIQHNGGSDFIPANGITGWEVIANGDLVPIASVYRHEPQTIRISLEHALAGKAQIRYLYGAMPDVKNPVMDNSPLSLPLEEFQSDIN